MESGALYNQLMRLLRNIVGHGFYKAHDKILNTNDYGVRTTGSDSTSLASALTNFSSHMPFRQSNPA